MLDTINVVEMTADTEGEVTILGLRAYTNNKTGRVEAQKLFTQLIREDESENYEDVKPFTDKQITSLFRKGEYNSGSYIVQVVYSEKK